MTCEVFFLRCKNKGVFIIPTLIEGNKGKLKITEIDDVTVNDTSANTTCVVAKNAEIKGKILLIFYSVLQKMLFRVMIKQPFLFR